MWSILSSTFPIVVENGDCTTGRRVLASRSVKAGEVVLASSAIAVEPLDVLHHCAGCFAAGSELLQCAKCKCVKYCSIACQRQDWKLYHRAECASVAALTRMPEAMAQYAQNAILLGRLVRRKEASGQRQLLGAGREQQQQQHYSHCFADVEAMERDGRTRDIDAWTVSVRLAKDLRLVPREADDEACRALVSSFARNNFVVCNDLMVPKAAGCFPAGALLNHSCAPNCSLSYSLTDGGVAGSPGDRCHVQTIRALVDIAAGEELLHSYVEIATPYSERSRNLTDAYGFECRCKLCALEAPPSSPSSSAPSAELVDARGLCSRLDGGTLPHFICATFNSEAEREAASAFPPELSPEAAHDIKVARSLGQLISLDGRVPLDAEVLGKLGVSAEVAAHKYAASRGAVSGLDAADQSRIELELTCVEVALERIQRHLRASHLDVHALTNLAMNRYMTAEDSVAAFIAVQRVIAFERAAYALTPAHPMLGLQLFTAADLAYDIMLSIASYLNHAEKKGASAAMPPSLLSVPRHERLAALYSTSAGSQQQGAEAVIVARWAWSSPISRVLQRSLAVWAIAAYGECGAVLSVTYGPSHEFVRTASDRLAECGKY